MTLRPRRGVCSGHGTNDERHGERRVSVGDLHPAPSLEQAREHTVRRLCEHFAADDLKVEDFETRLDRAYEATTETGRQARRRLRAERRRRLPPSDD